MKEITKENTVAEIVSKNLGSDHIFSKYKIDFCCGGGDTLETVCNENGIQFNTLKQEIEAINNKIAGISNLNDLDIVSLISIAKSEYHDVISNHLAEIVPFASKVSEVHSTEHEEVAQINAVVQSLEVVINGSFKNAIDNMHAAINDILTLDNPYSEIVSKQVINLKSSIKKSEIIHLFIAKAFKRIARLSSEYTTPEGACNSYKFLYRNLQQIEHTVHKYMHFEKNVMIPKALKII